MVRILLEQKAQVHECDEDGWNPLHFCAWNAGKPGSAETAELLLGAGAKVLERVSICHAEDDDQMDRRGATASEIVKRRMPLMTDAEMRNAQEVLTCLQNWEAIVAEKQAKIAEAKKKQAQYEDALANAKRRSSMKRGSVRKPSSVVQEANK